MAGKKNKLGITQANITSRIKAAAREGRISITTHATKQALRKNVTDEQMREVARAGMQVKTEPPDQKGQNPKAEMRKRVAGDDVTIIASIWDRPDGETAVIITGWKRN